MVRAVSSFGPSSVRLPLIQVSLKPPTPYFQDKLYGKLPDFFLSNFFSFIYLFFYDFLLEQYPTRVKSSLTVFIHSRISAKEIKKILKQDRMELEFKHFVALVKMLIWESMEKSYKVSNILKTADHRASETDENLALGVKVLFMSCSLSSLYGHSAHLQSFCS